MDESPTRAISAIRADLHEMRLALDEAVRSQQCCELRWNEISRSMDGIKFWLSCIGILIVLVPAMMGVMR